MDNIIEKLYFIYSEENNICDNPEYSAAFKAMSGLMDDIAALLPKEKISLTDELYEQMSKMMLAEAKEMFAGGFKTAQELFSECSR